MNCYLHSAAVKLNPFPRRPAGQSHAATTTTRRPATSTDTTCTCRYSTSTTSTFPTSTPTSDSPNAVSTQVPETATPAHTVDIKGIEELEILAQLVSRTGATEIQATEEEEKEMAEISEFNVRRDKDRQEVREKLVKERRDAELLRLARGEVASAA